MTAPTPRETADHAERSPSIAEEVEGEVRSGVSLDHAELAAECVRGLQSIEDRVCEGDPFRFTGGSIYFKSIKVIRGQASEIAALRGQLSQANKNAEGYLLAAEIHLASATQAERQRDELHQRYVDANEARIEAVGLLREYHPPTSEAYRDHSLETRAETFLANQGAE